MRTTTPSTQFPDQNTHQLAGNITDEILKKVPRLLKRISRQSVKQIFNYVLLYVPARYLSDPAFVEYLVAEMSKRMTATTTTKVGLGLVAGLIAETAADYLALKMKEQGKSAFIIEPVRYLFSFAAGTALGALQAGPHGVVVGAGRATIGEVIDVIIAFEGLQKDRKELSKILPNLVLMYDTAFCIAGEFRKNGDTAKARKYQKLADGLKKSTDDISREIRQLSPLSQRQPVQCPNVQTPARDSTIGFKGQGSTRSLATALVLDRSGSMDWQSGLDSAQKKIVVALRAANLYVDGAEPQEACSVSLFSSGAETRPDLGMGACGKASENLKRALSGVSATGGTNVGAGLEAAFRELKKLGNSPSPRIAILLSDGVNTVGEWRTAACRFALPAEKRCPTLGKGWPVYTVGLYTDRAVLRQVAVRSKYGAQTMVKQEDEETNRSTLRQIAEMTGGRFLSPSSANLGGIFALIRAHSRGETTSLNQSDFLARDGTLGFKVPVTPAAESLTVIPSWYGSSIETTLISPSGRAMKAQDLVPPSGRYVKGDTYEIAQINKPVGGTWQIRLRWAVPPEKADGERVNLTVSEKSDVSVNILGFRGEYEIDEPVTINVDATETVDNKRHPLNDARVRVTVQKPGDATMARMIRARPINFATARRKVGRGNRVVQLYDDGTHNDYRVGDGIFGGKFSETNENGAYLVTVTVTGRKRNGQRVQRRLIASFQVGPISENPVTTAQVIEYLDLLGSRTDPVEAIERIRSDPLGAIKGSRSDPLDAINKLRLGR